MITLTIGAFEKNRTRLINQIFKLLPMYENGEDWKIQKEALVLECRGYSAIFAESVDFLSVIAKLAALDFAEDHFAFRKLVFETITALKAVQYEP